MKKSADKTAKKQRGRPFKKGQSGNPSGRPRGSKNFSTLFGEAVKKIAKEKKLPVKDPEVEMVVKAIAQALKGNYPFFRDLMDRKYGKPKEKKEVEITPRKPMIIIRDRSGEKKKK